MEVNIFDALYEAGLDVQYSVDLNDTFVNKYGNENMVFFAILYYLEYRKNILK